MVELACSGLLFDLDGVLIDSTPAVARVWTRWAIAHGFDPEDTVRRAHGRPSLTTIRELLPNADARAENAVVERGEIEDTEGVVPLPGAREFLDSLPDGVWAIITSCTHALARTRLRAAGRSVPRTLVTSDDVKLGKPNPEPYIKGAAMLGVPPQNCIVFEDAPAGVRAGKGTGAIVVAFTTTSSEEELEDTGADFIISGFASVSLVMGANGSQPLRMRISK